jgi:TadE-like protein
MIKPKHRSKSEHAQTMVEFAIVFPILLLLTYGLIEFGRMIFIYVSVTSAAREGARYGAGAGYIDATDTTRYYMYCDGMRTAIRRGAILTQIPDGSITVWYDHGPGTAHFPDAGNRCPSGAATYNQDLIKLGDRVGVHLSVQYTPIIEFLGFNGFTIQAQSARTVLTDLEFNPP